MPPGARIEVEGGWIGVQTGVTFSINTVTS